MPSRLNAKLDVYSCARGCRRQVTNGRLLPKEHPVSTSSYRARVLQGLRSDQPREIVLAVVVAATLLDPSETLIPHLKYGSLLALALLTLMFGRRRYLSEYRSRTLLLYVLSFAVILPAYGILIHFARGDYPGGHWSIFLGSNVFLVLPILVAMGVPRAYFERLVVGGLTGIAALTWILFLTTLLLPPDAREALYEFGSRNSLYTLQTRNYAGVTLPNVYYYTSPMMVLALAYWGVRFAKRDGGWRVAVMGSVVAGALFLSGTRMNILLGLALVLASVWKRSRVAFAAATLALGLLIATKVTVIAAMLASGDTSNRVKLDYLHEYSRLFSNPVGLSFGYGLGSCLKSSVLAECIPVTELTYVDLVRIFGLVAGLPYLALLGIVLWWLRRRSEYTLLGYGSYLLMAALNPYVFSTNGMLVLSLALVNALSSPDPVEKPWDYGSSVPSGGPRSGPRPEAVNDASPDA